jgi:hypothetical protein
MVFTLFAVLINQVAINFCKVKPKLEESADSYQVLSSKKDAQPNAPAIEHLRYSIGNDIIDLHMFNLLQLATICAISLSMYLNE